MEIQIKTPGHELAPAVTAHIESRVETFSRYAGGATESAVTEVHIERIAERPQQGRIWRVKLGVPPRGKTMHVESPGETITEAFDLAKDEMDLRLKGLKDKKRTLLRRGGSKIKGWLRIGSDSE